MGETGPAGERSREEGELTPQELRLRALLRILAAAFFLGILAYLLPALFGPFQEFFVNLPFVTNSVVKIGGLALLAFFASGDVRKRRLLTILLIWGHVISILAMTAVLIWGDTAGTYQVGPWTWTIRGTLFGAMVLDGTIAALLLAFFISADRARYDLAFFWPVEFRSLAALAEVSLTGADGRAPVIGGEDVARNVDEYLARFEGKTKRVARLALVALEFYPLLSFKPPLSYLDRAARRQFIEKRFYQDVTLRLIPQFLRVLVRALIGMGKQLSYLGYYNDPRTFASVGYVPFSQRPTTPQRLRDSPSPPRRPLRVRTASDVTGETLDGDVVVIGSGAGASILANRLVKSGRSVLMIERGDYFDPAGFTEDEAEMLGKLYADGALQLTRAFDFQIIQGSCVGGSTVVNNAVCFDLPENVLARWNDAPLLAGLDPEKLRRSFKDVRASIGVERQPLKSLNPTGDPIFGRGVRALALEKPPNSFNIVEANVHECLGCGYCNIGCRYGRKLSMLDRILPETQAMGSLGAESLTIVAGCEAERLRGAGGRITAVTCRFTDGRRIDVRGNVFVVAAGAVSSSLLLERSGAGGRAVGKNLAFNMGSPISALFDETVDAYAGLQISHYLEVAPNEGYVLETWYNPPVAQSLSMPGWFEDHFRNMLRFNRMAATGILVGTESNAEVSVGGLTGRDINFEPTPGDLQKVLKGLSLAGRIYLAAGARAVMPSTFRYFEFKNEAELARLPDFIRDSTDMTLGTGHPQGGNAVSRDSKRGVVDPEFRVYGYDNLFVCDASVFPSSIGVNPQLTVMALADYAAPFVAAAGRG
ncbi:MAG TPA: GMC family oxidoreductase [Thermoanaerobaculia bacterium]|nr:GMC family oxidoreductase [Thermoanaerobaculia bacterium]